ncbi:MAG: sigma-70 family RNA polymerase sigma factor [Bacteroidales bacterium]|nr:sigma-70 family RNA polymerase sigma factor [Bacteroidales bacterium]
MTEKEKLAYRKIEQLYVAKKDILTAQAFKFINDAEQAHDIVSESFISLIEHRDSIGSDKFSEYLYQIMRNKCLSYRRDDTVHQNVYRRLAEKEGKMMEFYTRAIEGTTMTEVQTSEIMSIYRERISKLPPLQYRIFHMSRSEGKTREEIAAELGISENKVKYEMTKVLSDLRRSLKDYSDILFLIVMILS